MTILTERRKSDRAKMAEAVHATAINGGMIAEIDADTFLGTRAVIVRIEGPRGVRLSIDFDGASCQPDTHVLSWHMDIKGTARFVANFAPSVNNCHYRKATDIAYGFDALLSVLRERFSSLRDGSAFMDDES